MIVDEVGQADERNMSQIAKKWKTNLYSNASLKISSIIDSFLCCSCCLCYSQGHRNFVVIDYDYKMKQKAAHF